MFQLSDATSTTVIGVVAATPQHLNTIAVASEQRVKPSQSLCVAYT
jgi:hypothetical protein